MRALADIIGILLLIQGIGGLLGPHVPVLGDEFGLLPHVVDGGTLTVLQAACIVVGVALVGLARIGNTSAGSAS
ncbi:hypothetical protein [Phytoactinopolyspora halotolerans]|uniref:Uncharacterized protein n=1 Tax=Phytoactinopolyspora halotolerans TaxID=1981512 RepID=A0A6L9SB85_9ACTN|nr:hypothetical protein [Phytoactinopolyspora halotolerans]NEE02313.1 hypothetical protein [Phytoactinopolyspora halotolerans]